MIKRIPGLAALASLKPNLPAESDPADRRIPGLAALASLKHDVVEDDGESFVSRIPGLAALASLKHARSPRSLAP